MNVGAQGANICGKIRIARNSADASKPDILSAIPETFIVLNQVLAFQLNRCPLRRQASRPPQRCSTDAWRSLHDIAADPEQIVASEPTVLELASRRWD
jgi:hypothetical protein